MYACISDAGMISFSRQWQAVFQKWLNQLSVIPTILRREFQLLHNFTLVSSGTHLLNEYKHPLSSAPILVKQEISDASLSDKSGLQANMQNLTPFLKIVYVHM